MRKTMLQFATALLMSIAVPSVVSAATYGRPMPEGDALPVTGLLAQAERLAQASTPPSDEPAPSEDPAPAEAPRRSRP